MKLTKEEKRLFMETHNKWLKESSWLGKLFAKGVSSKIKNDKDVQRAVDDTDRVMKQTRDKIEKYADGDEEEIKKNLSPAVRKALGFDY